MFAARCTDSYGRAHCCIAALNSHRSQPPPEPSLRCQAPRARLASRLNLAAPHLARTPSSIRRRALAGQDAPPRLSGARNAYSRQDRRAGARLCNRDARADRGAHSTGTSLSQQTHRRACAQRPTRATWSCGPSSVRTNNALSVLLPKPGPHQRAAAFPIRDAGHHIAPAIRAGRPPAPPPRSPAEELSCSDATVNDHAHVPAPPLRCPPNGDIAVRRTGLLRDTQEWPLLSISFSELASARRR